MNDETDVELLTDEYGVSHVYADSRYALGYGQGYAQARDRLFQMDVLRHVGYGDSASVLGPSQVASDRQVRRDLYTRAELERQYERVPPEARAVLEGFAAGVNRRRAEAMRDLPAEFLTLGHLPEPWEPLDTVAILAYMIGFFGTFGGHEIGNAARFARLEETLGDRETAYEAYGDLNWLRVPDDHTATLDDAHDGGEDLLPFEAVPDEQLDLASAALGAVPWGEQEGSVFGLQRARGELAGFEWGSNALVVAGEQTETGSPLMFGGPQMGYFRPPVIHEVGLHGAGFDCAGIAVVGTPGVVIGRTPEFAWSVTSGYDDMRDTVAVRLHPTDDDRYYWRGRWREFRTEEVTHSPSRLGALADGQRPAGSETQQLAWIEAGGATMPVVAWNPTERVAWAQRTTTRGQELEAALSWAELGALDSPAEAEAHLAEFPFSFNFLFADDEEVRHLHTGRVPGRPDDVDPRLPVPADAFRWHGTRVGAGLELSGTDPERGYFCQWNNAPATGWRAGDAEGRWGSIHRVDLLDDVVQEHLADGPLSLGSVEAILKEAATRDPVARHSAPILADVARESEDPQVRAMADELDAWHEAGYTWAEGAADPDDPERDGGFDADGDGRYDFAAMAIWEETRQELQARVFGPVLGDLTPELVFDPPLDVHPEENEDPHAGDHARTDRDVALVAALEGETAHDWFETPESADDSRANRDAERSGGGDRDSVVLDAMGAAAETLTEEFDSDDPADWRRDLRTTGFSPMGGLPVCEIPMVNRGSWNQVVSPAEDRGRGVLAPSNVGHLSARDLAGAVRGSVPERLEDQLSLYEEFDYKPFPVARRRVEERAERRTTLDAEPPGRLPRLRGLLGR
ncbi:penicillin acylase family protein [Halomarina rubra]|uniref:Penicillin acylase family protein n=1 Tax=Halomarina rubra TaxID=2071873 RepID=A0ABD6ASW0_9EURY|nr:penicillin acylase family protein [Halomarina rubra]